MSWLGDTWKRNRNFVGNALKNVAPIVGALTGGVGGVAIGGLGAALGQAAREGSNIGDILKAGAENAAITGSAQRLGGEKLGKSLASAMKPKTPPIPVIGAPPVVDTGSILRNAMESKAPSVGPISLGAPPGVVPPMGSPPISPASSPGFWSRAGTLIEKHPTAASAAFQGLGKTASAIAGRGARDAESRLTAAQAARLEYELAREQESQRALQGLREQLALTMPTFGAKRKHIWEDVG